jgi:sporulation protein YlmC with PRC-barrel domain
MKEYRRVLSATTLVGDSVKNPQGEDIGKVEEIMIDLSSGRVAYVVLSFGGFLGMGEKLFAIPWNYVSVDEEQKCVIIAIDKEKLQRAQGFDKNNWPDMSDPAWEENNEGYYR